MSEQTDTTTTPAPVTHERALALQAAAVVLRMIAKDAAAAAWAAHDAGLPLRPYPESYGRLAEAAEIAEHVLFNVLNCAESQCAVEIPGGLVAFWRPPADERD